MSKQIMSVFVCYDKLQIRCNFVKNDRKSIENFFIELYQQILKMDKNTSRQRILELIRSKKEVLFGTVSKELTVTQKSEAWRIVTEEAKKLGVFPTEKDFKYLRDVVWPNYRKRTLTKLKTSNNDNYDVGGKKAKLDATDNIVIDIVGNMS